MFEIESYEELEQWASIEENVWGFLEKVKWDILANNPNKFVRIRDIAENLNWQFEGYAKGMHIICLPLSLSPEIEIEKRENEDPSLVAFKYEPDTEEDRDRLSRQESYHSFIKNVVEQAVQYENEGTPLSIWSEIYDGKVYHSGITMVVHFFNSFERERLDELLREAEERLRTAREGSNWDNRGPIGELYFWAGFDLNVGEFLNEDVCGGILVENPHTFITIKEIAEKLNWNFEQSEELLYFLCLPLRRLPDIIAREDDDYSLYAYKYKPSVDGSTWYDELWWMKEYWSFIKKVVGYFNADRIDSGWRMPI